MKKVIGVISVVLFIFILFQSCVAGLGNSIEGGEVTSGSTGLLLSFALLIAGILTLISRESTIVTSFAIGFFLLGALIGFVEPNPYGDLVIWTWMSLIFSVLLLISLMRTRKKNNELNNTINKEGME